MGFNTTVVVLNDALHDIETDPGFGRKLADAVLEGGPGRKVYVSAGNHANAATVISSHHADGMRCFVVGANRGQDLGYVGSFHSIDGDTESGRKAILRNLASNFGFQIAIKKKTNK